MTITFHCDNLCSKGSCCSPLRYMLLGSSGPVYNPAWEGPSCWDAHLAIHDPAKLAELYALALRPRGLVDGNHIRITHWVHPITNKSMIGIWWRSECVNADCDLPTARAKLLAIMKTDPDESSRDACKHIYGVTCDDAMER